MNSLATDNLAELIRKKHQVLVQLREIGWKQQKLANESASADLLQLLGAKQHLISALQLVEHNLRPFQAEDPETRQWRSAKDRADCARRAEECNQLLTEVMKLERSTEALMIDHRNQLAAQLKRAGSAHRAVDAYAQQQGPRVSPVTFQSEPIGDHIDLRSDIS